MPKTRHKRRPRTHNKTAGRCNCEHTFCGLQNWYKAKFEKLGWMILAKKNGWYDKVESYRNSIRRLKHAIEHSLTHHTRDHDRKEDLRIMCDNVCILEEHATHDFS